MTIKLVDPEFDKRLIFSVLHTLHLYRKDVEDRMQASIDQTDEIDRNLDDIIERVARVKALREQVRQESRRTSQLRRKDDVPI